ncbi:MAG TPA: substrate-binding domain-containing protein [Fimbriimonadaceae bacterium]|nr:substrate-binding domain-containing protein [Fimbriimonadaceae bacterium]
MNAGAKLLLASLFVTALTACSNNNPPTADNGSSAPNGTNVSNTTGSTNPQGTPSQIPTKPGTPVAPPSQRPPKGGPKPLVFFSQANSQDPWRQVFDAEIKEAAARHANDFTFEEQQANDSADTQITQINTEMIKKPAVMLVSPATIAVRSAIEEAHKQGVKVILLDRSVPGNGWDCYVGGDNNAIGYEAGQEMGKLLNGKGTVLMIQGIADAPPTKDRAAGFTRAIQANFPGIKVIPGDNCDYQRAKAETYMENYLQGRRPAFDAIYAHNDEMAIGAYMALQAAHAPKKIIVSIDGCQQEVVNMIKEGKLDASFCYPDPGPKGIDIAFDMLNGQLPAKKVNLSTQIITKETADAYVKAHPDLAK